MYRMVDTGTWDDPWFAELEPDAKLLFLYLLTNRRSTSAGVFEITVRAMAFETGLTPGRIEALLGAFGDRVVWWAEHQTVWLRNFYKRQRENSNEKFRLSAVRIVTGLPPDIQQRVWDVYPELSDGTGMTPESHPDPIAIPPQRETLENNTNSNSNSRATGKETATASPVPSRSVPKPQMMVSRCETLLDGSFQTIATMFRQLNKHLDETWLRAVLREAEPFCASLTKQQVGRALDLAHDRTQRGLTPEIHSPRGLAKKFVLDYLREQADAHVA